ncbi:MAG: M35 family metallopeptidase [Acidobacteria bacterium]|nr:M35 family metallopeptidase [Acidobacteriota bacterium]
MAKQGSERIKDALDHIKRAFAGHGPSTDGDKAKGATWDWLEAHKDQKGIAALISLGGFRGIKALQDESKTEMRHFQRGYLLILRTLGGKSDAEVKIVKARLVSTSGQNARIETENMKTEIRSVYTKWADKKKKKETPRIYGEPILAPSFQYANQLQKQSLAPALKRASELLTQAWVGIMRINLNTLEKKRYVAYFGAVDQTRYNKVKETLKAVHDVICSKNITLYYRGIDAPTDPGEDDTPQFLLDRGANTLGPSTAYGYVYSTVQKEKEWHVFLGRAFFEDASRHGRDSLSGVIIHEMTHLLKQTQDHRYGDDNCIALAKEVGGPAKAVENADSYEYYCESFQSKVTTTFG